MVSPFGDPEIVVDGSPFGDPVNIDHPAEIKNEIAPKVIDRRGLQGDSLAAAEELEKRGKIRFGDMMKAANELGPYLSPVEERLHTQYIKESREPKYAEMTPQEAVRYESLKEVIDEMGLGETFLTGMGKGFVDVARGVGVSEKVTPEERYATETLMRERGSAGLGEIVGQAAPFVIPGIGISKIASTPLRYALSAGFGGVEGGVVAAGEDKDVVTGAISGAVGAIGGESLGDVLPIVAKKTFKKITGRDARSTLIDESGNPSDEFQAALDSAGLDFKDIKKDTEELIKTQPAMVSEEQVARKALFEEEGIPITSGELTKDFSQLADEQRLLRSVEGTGAEELQALKLDQSNAIDEALRKNYGEEFTQQETGDLIKKVLTGRQQILRTEKNNLYQRAIEEGKEGGFIPILTDSIQNAIPDEKTLRRLGIQDKESMESLTEWLAEFGITPPTPKMKRAGVEPEALTLENFEDFRTGLNNIGSKSAAASVATSRVRNALDVEIDELSGVLEKQGAPADVIATTRLARKKAKELFRDFSPESLTGKIVRAKKDGETQVIEASKIYNELTKKSMAIENVKKVVKNLNKAGLDGQKAMSALRSTTILDLINAGYEKAKSRQIKGQQIFNPIAFRNRIENIGSDKIKTIFSGEPETLKSINRIKKIAEELTIDERAIPKGSAATPWVISLADKTGLSVLGNAIAGKMLPVVGPAVKQTIIDAAEKSATKKISKKAIKAEPEIILTPGEVEKVVKRYFPNITSAIGSSFAAEKTE